MEPEIESEHEAGRGISLPVVLAALIIALVAAAVIAWLTLVRDDDDEPPAAQPELAVLDLAAPLFSSNGPPGVLHAVIAPVREGENTFTVRVTDATQSADPAILPVESVDANLEPLAGDAPAEPIELQRAEDGSYQSTDPLQLENGWWELTATVARAGEEARTTRFYLLAPDPNINGFDAVPAFDSSSEAEEVFQAGIAQWEAMHSLKYIERLAGGAGAVSLTQREVSDGSDGNPAGSRTLSTEFELLTVEDRTWQRETGGPWVERTYLAIYPPSQWADIYEGATDFVLGKTVQVNDRETQIIMFHVPATDTLVAAWYVWWVDTETGYVIREAMTSRLHYMVYEFGEFNEPMLFEPPVTAASPVATPIASPSPA